MVDEKQNNIQDDVGDISVVLDSIKILSWSWFIAVVRAKLSQFLSLGSVWYTW